MTLQIFKGLASRYNSNEILHFELILSTFMPGLILGLQAYTRVVDINT